MLEDMHLRDEEIWRAIDRGDREIDWEAWFGHPEGPTISPRPATRSLPGRWLA
jgi:hypothetical protein